MGHTLLQSSVSAAHLQVLPVGLVLSKDGRGFLWDDLVCVHPLLQVLHLTQQSHQLGEAGGSIAAQEGALRLIEQADKVRTADSTLGSKLTEMSSELASLRRRGLSRLILATSSTPWAHSENTSSSYLPGKCETRTQHCRPYHAHSGFCLGDVSGGKNLISKTLLYSQTDFLSY